MVGTFKMKKNEMIFFNCVRNGPPFVKPKLAPGLCNRLRGMFTIYTYSKIADIPFGFSWHPESTCNCNFQDIFQVPTEFNHLPGLKFQFMDGEYPNKDNVADYLIDYASCFDLPIQLKCFPIFKRSN